MGLAELLGIGKTSIIESSAKGVDLDSPVVGVANTVFTWLDRQFNSGSLEEQAAASDNLRIRDHQLKPESRTLNGGR